MHVPLYDLGMRGRVCILPCAKLQSLIIDASKTTMSFESFWSSIVVEFYDPNKAIDMLSVLFYRLWGSFDVPKAIIEFVDDGDPRTISKVQVWGHELPSRAYSHDTAETNDSEYFLGMST